MATNNDPWPSRFPVSWVTNDAEETCLFGSHGTRQMTRVRHVLQTLGQVCKLDSAVILAEGTHPEETVATCVVAPLYTSAPDYGHGLLHLRGAPSICVEPTVTSSREPRPPVQASAVAGPT
jgi:hypothetical protein